MTRVNERLTKDVSMGEVDGDTMETQKTRGCTLNSMVGGGCSGKQQGRREGNAKLRLPHACQALAVKQSKHPTASRANPPVRDFGRQINSLYFEWYCAL